MFDTHCHLNFSRFKKNVNEVVDRAHKARVFYMTVPGTDLQTSKKAIEVAEKYDGVFAAVGIHPHHVYEFDIENVGQEIARIEELLSHPKVVAIGEVGMDKHVYENTKYKDYQVNEVFMKAQHKLFKEQVKLAVTHHKSLIVHNRETKGEISGILRELWDPTLERRSVFHCCEPDRVLLQFAKERHLFIGVDGDLTYWKEKQEFIKQVPLDMLVLETDSPFLLPEPLRSEKKYPNEPMNMNLISSLVAQLMGIPVEHVEKQTTQNGQELFGLTRR